MRWAFYNKLKGIYPDVSLTYGYITKNTRIENGLSIKEEERHSGKKTYLLNHVIDARSISGNPKAVSDGTVYYQKKVRCHDRQIHKSTILKGGIRKRDQADYEIKGFKLFDTVKYKGNVYTIFGRRNSGFFDIRTLDGTKVDKGSVSCKKLKLIQPDSNCLMERRRYV